MLTRFIVDNFDQASEAEAASLIHFLADHCGLDLEKAIRSSDGERFEEWFLKELYDRSRSRFTDARDNIWHVVEQYLRQHGGTFARLKPEQLLELERTLFEAGLAHTSHMVGIQVDEATRKKLKLWGWKDQEILDFPGWAYRFALIRSLIEQNKIRNFAELLRAAMAHPLSRAEQYAIDLARTAALTQLRPIFDSAGRLIIDEALKREQEALRTMVVSALEKRTHPFVLGREMFKMERAEGIFRDFERVARSEISNNFASGSWQADKSSGKFGDNDLVFRITRPQACRLCISLFVNPNGTPRLYRVRDLEQGTTPEIDIGVRKERKFRATIQPPHANCMCPPWSRYWGESSDKLFRRFAPRYIEGRKQLGLPIQEAA